MSRIFLAALLGALAGLAAWAIAAPFDPGSASNLVANPNYENYEHLFVFVMCGLIGLALGGVNGSFLGGKKHIARGSLVGLLIGTIGGYLGYTIGGALIDAIFGPNIFTGFGPAQILARIIGLAPLGAVLGLVLGATARSWRQALVGLVGGVIGAGLSGAVFDMVCLAMAPLVLASRGATQAEVGSPGRAAFAIITGLTIGLFTSLLQRVTRSAWVRLILGRNEAKEWIVDAPQSFIGREETVHIPIFGDPGVAPVHAVIQRHQGNYYLADCGSGAPTLLNGQPIQQVPLFSGAIITVGQSNLEFVMRTGSAAQKASEQFRSQYGMAPVGYQSYGQPAAAQPYQPQPVGPAQPYPQPQQYAQPYPQPAPSAPTQVQPAAAPVGSVAIIAIAGPLTGQRFDIMQPIEVGRDCPAIPMSFDGMVSRRHATFIPGPVGIVLTDLGSTNGTFVNDQRIQSTTLRPGDLVKMGVTVFRVE